METSDTSPGMQWCLCQMRLDTLELGIFLKYIISSRSISFNRHTVTQCPEEYIPVVLNKMGFVRTFAQAIAFRPSTHGGIGATELIIEQGIMIICEVMSFNGHTAA